MSIETEIENGAKVLEMGLDEAKEKFAGICQDNNLTQDNPVAVSLWRNFVANAKRSKQQNKNDAGSASGDSLFKNAFGFFVSLDAPRDMMSWNRNKAKEAFLRDSDKAIEDGIVAQATENALGKYVISRYHKGQYQEKIVAALPEGAETLEDGRIYIPLDSTETYMSGGTNRNFGKPLPKEQFRRTGIFYGSIAGGEMKSYYFSYKNQPAVDFQPQPFTWVHFICVANENGEDIYGATTTTLNSLSLNADLDPESDAYRDTSAYDIQEILVEAFSDKLTPLVELDRQHMTMQTLPAKERFVITDGTVCNMNMTPTSNGNRIINITDLNAEMDYENDTGMVTCWIPEHLELDFGIGSTVIVIGRTSQRQGEDGVEPATINTAGIFVTARNGSPVDVPTPVEEDFDWF
jgi:hypothetical protein